MTHIPDLLEALAKRLPRRPPSRGEVSKDDVVWVYRQLLGREPESSVVVERQASAYSDWRTLVASFLASPEYRNKVIAENAPVLSDMHDLNNIEVEASEPAMAELMSHIRKVWTRYGETEPYWSVLTTPRYEATGMSNREVEAFYASGASTVAVFEDSCRQSGVALDSSWSICDFGCGVGRVGEHFARRYGSYDGIDISTTHLAQAKGRFAELSGSGVELAASNFYLLEEYVGADHLRHDVFFSVLVLQHNPPPVIHKLLATGLSRVPSGGLAFFQVPNYIHDYRFSVADYLGGRLSGSMEMHPLPQPYVFKLLDDHGFEVLKALPDGFIGSAGLSLTYLAKRA